MDTALSQSNGVLSVHTLDEAASILRVKPSWLERQAAARKIPFTMLGGSYRFTAAHLAAIVRMHENAPSTQPERQTARTPRALRAAGNPMTGPLRARPRPGPRHAA